MNMLLIDKKYIGIISSRLSKFVRKSDKLYNCRCPICGDSKNNSGKTRGYFYEKKDYMLYYCHNCGASMRFATFLKSFDHNTFNDYVNETFLEKNKASPKPVTTPSIETFAQPVFQKTGILSGLRKISSLEVNHPAKMYIMQRKIPSDTHYKLFYTPKFKEYVNNLIPGKFADGGKDEPRIIIPFLDENKKCFGFQGRAIGPSKIRYITIILDDSRPKIFGLDTLQPEKKLFVVEGPIDSLFLPNAIAMAGSDASMDWLDKKHHSNVVFVYDNEPRNIEIVKKMLKVVERGFKIVIWPEHVQEKDINDMVLAGRSQVDILKMINDNTHEGLQAQLAITFWRKV